MSMRRILLFQCVINRCTAAWERLHRSARFPVTSRAASVACCEVYFPHASNEPLERCCGKELMDPALKHLFVREDAHLGRSTGCYSSRAPPHILSVETPCSESNTIPPCTIVSLTAPESSRSVYGLDFQRCLHAAAVVLVAAHGSHTTRSASRPSLIAPFRSLRPTSAAGASDSTLARKCKLHFLSCTSPLLPCCTCTSDTPLALPAGSAGKRDSTARLHTHATRRGHALHRRRGAHLGECIEGGEGILQSPHSPPSLQERPAVERLQGVGCRRMVGGHHGYGATCSRAQMLAVLRVSQRWRTLELRCPTWNVLVGEQEIVRAGFHSDGKALLKCLHACIHIIHEKQ